MISVYIKNNYVPKLTEYKIKLSKKKSHNAIERGEEENHRRDSER